MARKHAATAEEKQSAFDQLVSAGCTVAQAKWLSGVDEPAVTKPQLAERRQQWEADKPGVAVSEDEEQPEQTA